MKPYLPADFLNLPPDIRDALQAILPIGVIEDGYELPAQGTGLSTEAGVFDKDKKAFELKSVLANILQVFRLIKPSLPVMETDSSYSVPLEEDTESDPADEIKEVRFQLPPTQETTDDTLTPIKTPDSSPVIIPEQQRRPKRDIVRPALYRT